MEVSRVGVDGGGFFRGGGGWRRDFGGFPSSDVIPELAVFFSPHFLPSAAEYGILRGGHTRKETWPCPGMLGKAS